MWKDLPSSASSAEDHLADQVRALKSAGCSDGERWRRIMAAANALPSNLRPLEARLVVVLLFYRTKIDCTF